MNYIINFKILFKILILLMMIIIMNYIKILYVIIIINNMIFIIEKNIKVIYTQTKKYMIMNHYLNIKNNNKNNKY